MIYEAAVARTGELLPNAQVTGADDLSIEERIGTIPHEWMQNWWLEKLERIGASAETWDMFGMEDDEVDDEDLSE